MEKRTPFFCAEESANLGEELIGYAVTSPIYVLLECPPPWSPNALESQHLPANLNAVFEACKQAKLPIRPLLIHNPARQTNGRTIIIYRQKIGFSDGYDKQEFQVENPDEIADLLRQHLLNSSDRIPVSKSNILANTRDFLICTHGSHDQCCARFGNPFFRQAVAIVERLRGDMRVWQVSHIGCHRFAPTAIDFPEGRYYGRLDATSFAMILSRTGDIQALPQIYRGWGILPYEAQPVEQALVLRYGWDWFTYKLECRRLDDPTDGSLHRFEIAFQMPDGTVTRYRADVVDDISKMLSLQVSCKSQTCSELSPYWIKNLVAVESKNS